MTELENVRIVVNNGQDVHFTGRLVCEYTTQNAAGNKSRWTDLRLWETEGGAWVAESVAASDNDREVDFATVLVIEPGGEDEVPDVEAARLAVMDHFGWTTTAKAFAKEVGWDMKRRVA
jgi:hypothetical protein